jgi:hypothetical protein
MNKIRLSPSGPEIGTPPAQVGSSAVAGRLWGQSGVGSNIQVPGTVAGDVPGLTSVAVDLLPTATGYRYDVECDAISFGTGGGWKLLLLGSSDNGVTFPTTVIETADYSSVNVGGTGRVHHWGVALPVAIDHVKMQLQRNVAAGAALTCAPGDCTFKIREISPIS